MSEPSLTATRNDLRALIKLDGVHVAVRTVAKDGDFSDAQRSLSDIGCDATAVINQLLDENASLLERVEELEAQMNGRAA